uniref:MARVEL domain-containing protein n=1 Tax=Caenorhabditis tropicalis TaxID=1561998 RepID=A0A1I7U2N9_9PELO
MFSQRAFNGIVFCIRIFILVSLHPDFDPIQKFQILAIVSMILILTAPGACFSRYLNGQSISREICPGQNSIFPMNADRWSNALHFQGRGQNVYGQVALICITLAFGLITVGVSCVTLAMNSILTYPQILISGLSMIAFLVTGGVETWYATGYDHMEFFIQAVGNGVFSGCAGIPGCQIQFVVKGWAVAAAFYFLGALLYVVDMALIFISRENEAPPPVVFRSNRTIRSSF